MFIDKVHVAEWPRLKQGSLVTMLTQKGPMRFVVTQLGIATMDELKPHPPSHPRPEFKSGVYKWEGV